MYYQAVLDC